MKAEFLTPVVTIFDEEGNLDKEGNKKSVRPSYRWRCRWTSHNGKYWRVL